MRFLVIILSGVLATGFAAAGEILFCETQDPASLITYCKSANNDFPDNQLEICLLQSQGKTPIVRWCFLNQRTQKHFCREEVLLNTSESSKYLYQSQTLSENFLGINLIAGQNIKHPKALVEILTDTFNESYQLGESEVFLLDCNQKTQQFGQTRN